METVYYKKEKIETFSSIIEFSSIKERKQIETITKILKSKTVQIRKFN